MQKIARFTVGFVCFVLFLLGIHDGFVVERGLGKKQKAQKEQEKRQVAPLFSSFFCSCTPHTHTSTDTLQIAPCAREIAKCMYVRVFVTHSQKYT